MHLKSNVLLIFPHFFFKLIILQDMLLGVKFEERKDYEN